MNGNLSKLATLLGYGGDIEKALSASSSGFDGVNLEPQAKLMLPFFNGLRRRTPTDTAARGALTADFKVMMGFPSSFSFADALGSAEAAVGSALDANATTFQAPYATQAIKGEVNLEAIDAAKEFDDPFGAETATLLSALFRLEEMNLFGGNRTALVDGTSDGTAAGVGTGSYTSVPHYVVTALTYQGTLASATSDPVKGAVIANAKLGESVGQDITASNTGASQLCAKLAWNPVPGAVGYKIYAGASAAAAALVDPATQLAHPSTSSTVLGTAWTVPTGQTYITETACQVYGGAASGATHGTADGTANANQYEGYIAWSQKNTIYGKALSQNHFVYNAAGNILTPTGSGIAEFDYILQNLWSSLKISPTLGVGSANTIAAVSNALMGINSGFTNRIDLTAERGRFVGGAYVGGYVNKFAGSMLDGQQPSIDFWAHPEFPDGTILFLTEKVPYAYSRESRGWALDVRRPYTYWDLARNGISYPFSLLVNETLKCYHPTAQSSIVGLRVQ